MRSNSGDELIQYQNERNYEQTWRNVLSVLDGTQVAGLLNKTFLMN